jgi:hypothetical protein
MGRMDSQRFRTSTALSNANKAPQFGTYVLSVDTYYCLYVLLNSVGYCCNTIQYNTIRVILLVYGSDSLTFSFVRSLTHSISTQSSTASPSPQSVFHEAPRTNIHGVDDTEDRMALVPELARAMAAVNDVLQHQVAAATGRPTTTTTSTATLTATSTATAAVEASSLLDPQSLANPDLPWLWQQQQQQQQESPDVLVPPEEGEETSNILRPWDSDSENNDNGHGNDNTTDDYQYDSHDDDGDGDDDNGEVNVNAILDELFDPAHSSSAENPTTTTDTDTTPVAPRGPQYNARDLQNLATLLDRLGRTLTDAAPQIASLAANLPLNPDDDDEQQEDDDDNDEDVMYEEAVEQALEEIAESLPATESSSDTITSPEDTPIGGLLSLWSRERRRHSRTSTTTAETAAATATGNATTGSRRSATTSSSRRTGQAISPLTANNRTNHNTPSIDPDHEDYVSGLVNTTRGEVRTGPRSRSSNNDDVANLLGAYLTAATLGGAMSSGDGDGEPGGAGGLGLGLGQLLRGGSIGGGGTGGGGIDIHIHAVVTAPGMPPGGVGITTLGGGGGVGGGGTGTTGGTGLGGTRNLFSSTRRTGATGSILRSSRHPSSSLLSSRRRTMNTMEDEEDMGLFAELYSETPDPIDPNGSPGPRERTSAPRQASLPNLGQHQRNDNDDGDDASDYITGLRSPYGSNSFRREIESPAEFLARINHQAGGTTHLDHTNVGAASVAGRSSTRRRSSRRSFRRESSSSSDQHNSADTQHHHPASPRRSSGWGRLFRRRSSRDP